MSPTPHAPRTARRYAWLRVLVVLVALLMAGAHTGAVTADSLPVSTAQTCGAEYDQLTATPAPTNPQGHRTVASSRPGPPGGARPSGPEGSAPALAWAPYSPTLHALRTVVLRC
ncbi:hypothetical protein [Streptomyces chiangmaiensis]|uniref:Secreted protein n=1 Tax=Streptomyces chiangmaiensis TaxID=766497 RepID=A0ABU7FPL4_9ACTN|nr:hypothetical protein [Streptomyces chiangmaiensis]MED7826037.1 hypothetical protein [Streptomyces chiangmaiensis]